ncbi:ABC transporter ATP-binding protein [Pisciglobus halotolerans]|uniref:ATP-binding cassette, subfamily B n=1 Tax=Pisciglobus halotolerans TaxID=745365 RepID=A0A1I3ALY9_9LACT|nr:ABC transporter ATP-binding protein [Pisciglobus halotolerans]SFH51040.1 ATP-binding cassette, subfamily B [Pisciglobus halotolerans]
MNSIKWVWQYIRPYLFGWSWASIMVVAVALLNIVTPYVGGLIVDNVIYNGESDLLLPLLGLMLLGTFVRTILRYTYQIKFERIGQNALYQIREDLYTKLQELDFTFFNTTRVGDIMARMTGDTDAIRHAIAWLYFNVLDNIVLFVSALIVLSTIEWRLTLALLIVTPFIALFTILLSIKANGAFYEIRESFAKLNSMVEENIGGNKVVKAFANEAYEEQKFDVRNEGFKKANMDSVNISKTYLPVLETLAGFMAVISVGLGGFFVLNGMMSVGNLVAFNGLIWMLNTPMRNVGGYMNDMQRFITATYKIREMLNTKPLIPVNQKKSIQEMRGEVEFQNVSFAFADEPEHFVLSHISFRAEPGETIGILGETGSGKSTLVNMISRFFDPTEGRVLIDGEDARRWNVLDLRKQIAIVMQDVFLFSDTIKGNISYGKPSAEFEDIEQVARVADASQFIEKMPERYETYLGERGSGLSGGQRQRLSLARGLIKHPKILILDDTTSAVDMETEVKIQKGMKDVSRDTTTFIIANRISSVKNADQILIMSKGEIIERGQHEELLARKGSYYDIYQEQLGQSEVEEEEDEDGSSTD